MAIFTRQSVSNSGTLAAALVSASHGSVEECHAAPRRPRPLDSLARDVRNSVGRCSSNGSTSGKPFVARAGQPVQSVSLSR
jgi:hypothetical protein